MRRRHHRRGAFVPRPQALPRDVQVSQTGSRIARLRPARTVDRWTGSVTVRFRTFRKHRRPCGQPAVVGEIGRFRPLPPQAGHFIRIKATPSDLPFKSTGFAMYPEPPQAWQSSGATPSPLVLVAFCPRDRQGKHETDFRYETRTKFRPSRLA